MTKLTPTFLICGIGALVAVGLLALPPSDTIARPTPAPTAPGAAAPVTATGTEAATSLDLVIDSFAFGPATLTVPAGSTIRVVNRDSVEHTVSADAGAFDQFVESGESATFVAPSTPGTYSYFCQIHPSMTGVLIVT